MPQRIKTVFAQGHEIIQSNKLLGNMISATHVLKCGKPFPIFLHSLLLGLSPVTLNPFSVLMLVFLWAISLMTVLCPLYSLCICYCGV